jgi:hypothetical protein
MKGWLDNFGKADNANDSNINLPEGFVGIGYDTKGRNYSPAWGGQFAMGGSIPGSVGFTYARVAGSAPSKGKYAKKTMASAQIGKNVKKDETNIDTNIANKIAGFELQQNPEYQYWKYLQSQPQLRQAPGRGEELMRQGLGYADVATDVMQMGNFIPHPTAQAVGKVGNIAGMIVDGLQGADDAYRGNYLSAGINFGSAVLPSFLGANTFRRPAMMLRPGDPLYPLTEQARRAVNSPINLTKSSVDYIEPFTKVKEMTNNSLLWNRGLLGALGAETAYDAGLIGPVKKEYGGEIPSAQNGIMTPMLLARNVLNYFYPGEETTPTVSAAPVEYKKGLTDELLKRQAYKESTFNPAAVSPAGYKGLTQIGEGVLQDYSNKKGGKKLDPFNPKDAVELQKFAMGDLYNAGFINKPEQSDSVRIAKTLAAYNWGRGNLYDYLGEQKKKGVDIYNSYDWLNDLPKETSDYVNKILLQEDPSFNKNYKKASTNPKYEEVTSLYDQKKFGGDIPSAQKGKNDVEKISINDPRYPEMYKNRQVGLSYDGTISLPDLDEVTVTAPRSYTMDSLRDFTTAALYGAPANAMKLSMIPQAAMTEGIEALRGKSYDFSNVNPNFGGFTSNQRDLSQTMGYENPEGFLQNAANIGLSMIDPLAFVGGAGARNLAKPSKSIFGQLFRAYDPSNLKTQSGLDWSKKWYNNPEIVQRKKAMAYGDFDDDAINNAAEFNSKAYVQYAKESLNQYKPKSYIDLLKDKGLKEYFNHGLTTGGLSYGRPDQIYVNRPMYFPFDKQGLESVRVHELSHLVNRNGSGLAFPEEKKLLKPFGFEDDIVRLNKLKEIKSGSKKKWASYYTEPTEIKARMDQARFDLNLSPEDKFTPEMFDKISKKNNFYGMGKYIKDKDAFVDLMNKFWAVPAVGVAVGAQAADQQKNGGNTPSAQNGQEMKFYQNGLDWKPKSMQEGGKIYEGQELPEFVVEGKDERIKNAMSQGMANFYGHVGELMGAPQKEMMQLITGKEQTPSEAFGFQNTGGWLDSPTSFGKNALNFGMDAFADPLNAVGVGLADDIFKLGVKNVGKNLTENLGKGIGNRAILQAPSPQMMADDVSAQLTNNSNQLGNTATQVPNSDPFRYQQRWQEKKDEILKNIETEEGRKRLQGLIDKNQFAKRDNLTVDDFIERFKQTKFEVEKPRQIYLRDQNGDILRDANGWPIRGFEKNPDGTVKLYPNSPTEAYHWPREGLDNPSFMYAGQELTPYDVGHTLEHEFGHFFQYGDIVDEIEKGVGSLADIKLKDNIGGGGNFRDVINKFNPFYKKISDLGESETRKIFGFTNPLFGFEEAKRYWNIGGGTAREKYPFAAEIRENLLQSGILKNRYDEITPEMLKKHKRLYEKRTDDRYYLRLYEIMQDTKDNFKILSDALNKMPAVALPAAGGAAALTSGLQDEQPVQKQKNGGITKDNRGYWNPDNWGQPVEIDSNMITMQGVYEPLLGISDTGDTKLMQPGKNYKFKGKKVTEFPVAKLGINQLDAQPMKKLNQLLNFTNNPDKDNWLDKYN